MDMKSIYRNNIFILSLLIITSISLLHCANNRSKPTIPETHPDNWMISSSEDFHGKIVLNSGSAGCKQCHGADFDGGLVDVSCIDCHAERTNICTGCHGGIINQSGAPPSGLRGETSDTARAVGAHTAHLNSSSLSEPLNCSDCHSVPAFALEINHFDSISPVGSVVTDSIAEIIWGRFSDGGTANWNRVEQTCSGTYCHGAFDGGNQSNRPIWNQNNQAECGSCHDIGAEPANLLWKHQYHITTANLDCAVCHASVVDSTLAIVDPGLHINGSPDILIADTSICNVCHVDGQLICTGCHGGLDNNTGAPPYGLENENLISQLAVGAHTSHLDGNGLTNGIDCSECHTIPLGLTDAGHLDADNIAELNWGLLAGASSSWNRNNAECSNTYCHGNFGGGNPSNTPVWTDTDQATCGSCHDVGTNPSDLAWKHDYHMTTAGLECADCHSSVTNDLLEIVGLNQHINGQIDTLTADTAKCNVCHGDGPISCTSCHGGLDNSTGAPPYGLEDETLTSQLAVGAHTAHIEGGSLADPFACSDCHIVPDTLTANGHLGADNIAELNWSPLAGNSSTWNRTTAECSDTYCHGNFAGGYSSNSPIWTGSVQANCGSCHDAGANPEDLSGKHKKHFVDIEIACRNCHNLTQGQFNKIIGPQYHIDGEKTVSFSFAGNFNNGTCSGLPNGCHGSENWYD